MKRHPDMTPGQAVVTLIAVVILLALFIFIGEERSGGVCLPDPGHHMAPQAACR